MLVLALLAATLTPSAFAVDTSGCSQLLESRQTVQGSLGALTATYARAPRENCWNADQARIDLDYSYAGPQAPVSFWINVNGSERTLPASVSCSSGSSGYAKDTRNERPQNCVAHATLPVRLGRQELEVAPIVNGTFDTQGFGKNLRLSF
jgi:hypothetical protein